jgi:nucleoside-diphosphate-sugar epimerase
MSAAMLQSDAIVAPLLAGALGSRGTYAAPALSPTIYGDGEQSRDFTYIDDVVDANLLAIAAGEDAFRRVLNIAGGRPSTSVNRLLTLIAQLTGRDPEAVYEPPREGDIRRSEADISAAAAAIGYRPRVAIEEGLERTVAWYSAVAER